MVNRYVNMKYVELGAGTRIGMDEENKVLILSCREDLDILKGIMADFRKFDWKIRVLKTVTASDTGIAMKVVDDIATLIANW